MVVIIWAAFQSLAGLDRERIVHFGNLRRCGDTELGGTERCETGSREPELPLNGAGAAGLTRSGALSSWVRRGAEKMSSETQYHVWRHYSTVRGTVRVRGVVDSGECAMSCISMRSFEFARLCAKEFIGKRALLCAQCSTGLLDVRGGYRRGSEHESK